MQHLHLHVGSRRQTLAVDVEMRLQAGLVLERSTRAARSPSPTCDRPACSRASGLTTNRWAEHSRATALPMASATIRSWKALSTTVSRDSCCSMAETKASMRAT